MRSDHSRSSPSFGGTSGPEIAEGPAVAPELPKSLEDAIAQACGDPGSIVGVKGESESVPRWSTRAVVAVLRGLLPGWSLPFSKARPSKPLVIIESRFAGDVAANVAYAKRAVRDCLLRGEAPIASHLLFTRSGILDDAMPEERALGIDSGLEWYRAADLCVVYVDRGISAGMELGMGRAKELGVPIEWRSIGVEPVCHPVGFEPPAGDEAFGGGEGVQG